jgi:hypothetical protein
MQYSGPSRRCRAAPTTYSYPTRLVPFVLIHRHTWYAPSAPKTCAMISILLAVLYGSAFPNYLTWKKEPLHGIFAEGEVCCRKRCISRTRQSPSLRLATSVSCSTLSSALVVALGRGHMPMVAYTTFRLESTTGSLLELLQGLLLPGTSRMPRPTRHTCHFALRLARS